MNFRTETRGTRAIPGNGTTERPFFRDIYRGLVLRSRLKNREFASARALVEDCPSDAMLLVKSMQSTNPMVSVHAQTTIKTLLTQHDTEALTQTLLALNVGMYRNGISGVCAELLATQLSESTRDTVMGMFLVALKTAPLKAQREILRWLAPDALKNGLSKEMWETVQQIHAQNINGDDALRRAAGAVIHNHCQRLDQQRAQTSTQK